MIRRWTTALRELLRRFDPDRDPDIVHLRQVKDAALDEAGSLRESREAREARWDAEARASGNELIEWAETATVREER